METCELSVKKKPIMQVRFTTPLTRLLMSHMGH